MKTSKHTDGDRVVIALSAGYFGFFAHAGFMLAVEELGIDYKAISGSSAGAIVASLHASGVPASEIVDILVSLRRSEVWDSTGVGGIVQALIRRGRGWTGWLKGDLFEQAIKRHLRARSFEECSRSLYGTAFNLTKGEDETFSEGTIADKVRASCSYPFLMRPKRIEGCDYWDGGFLSKVPLEEMVRAERPGRIIVHYLSTQEDCRHFKERSWSGAALLETALTAARKEIERHRLNALSDLIGKMTWVEPVVPRVGPRNLGPGRSAVEAAYRHAMKALSAWR